jgi:AcrR family transcriptional regulator
MSTRTAEWTVPHPPGTGVPQAEGLRERKKRLMRQQLSDTATRMFLAQGFDAVRVTEIAEACGVSEKTVFNYFPTKESLILDRLEATVASLRTGLTESRESREPGESGQSGQSGFPPVQAALRILDDELGAMTSWLAAQDDPLQAGAMIRRFGELIQATPSLRAHQSDMMDQFTAVAAEILAERAGLSPEDPEPQITATALLGLWRIQFQALSRYLDGTRTPAQVHQAVTADVRRAAQLISTGLNSLTTSAPGPDRHQDIPGTTATEHASRLTARFSRAGWFGGSGGFRRGRRCFRRRGWGWCEPGGGDVCHHDRHDHQRHDGHAV